MVVELGRLHCTGFGAAPSLGSGVGTMPYALR
jgi:hypothetical protein